MKTRNTVIWLLIFTCLAGFVYYYEIIGGEKRQQAEETAKKIFHFTIGDISEIQLTQQGSKIHCIKNNDQTWKMVEPLQTTADKSAVESVIASILNAKIERVIGENTQDLQPYNLDNPTLKIILTSADKNYTLLIGKNTPTKDFLYAKRESEHKVFLITANLRQQLSKNVYALRDKKIIKAPAKQVAQLHLKYPKSKIMLKQDLTKGWQIIQPITTQADNKQIGEILGILNGIDAQKFVAETVVDLAQYGLDNPQVIIEITMRDNSQQILLLGKDNDSQTAVYASLHGQEPVFTLPKQTREFLTKSVFALRDKNLFYFLPDDIDKIELTNAKQHVLVKRNDDATWVTLKPETAVVDTSFMKGLLKNIAKLQAQEFVDQPKPNKDYGFGNPILKINLWLKDKSTQTLIVGAKKPQTKLTYAKAKEPVTLLKSEAIEQLNRQLIGLHQSLISKIP